RKQRAAATDNERQYVDQMTDEVLSRLNQEILPALKALNDPDAYALPRAGYWLALQLMKHSTKTQIIKENVRWLSQVSVEGSALFFAMIGPHLRKQFI